MSSSSATYNLVYLRDFLSKKGYHINKVFIVDNLICFLILFVESIGEHIFVYVPSKYKIEFDKEKNTDIPAYELIPYQLEDSDLLHHQNNIKEYYGEINNEELRDEASYTNSLQKDNYKAINIEFEKESDTKRELIRFSKLLEKIKNCTSHTSYKFLVLTDKILCMIDRRNDVDCFIISDGKNLVNNSHELYVMIDLEKFYTKIDQIGPDVILLYKHFYNILNTTHTKMTALAESKIKTYQNLTQKAIKEYNQKHKLLTLIESLTKSLEKTLGQEKKLSDLFEKVKEEKDRINSVSKDTELSFRYTKLEKDLQNIREIRTKINSKLKELKDIYHHFLLDYDYAIYNCVEKLGEINAEFKLLGIDV